MEYNRLLLFTAHYPYSLGYEHAFIEPELPFLKDQFDQITILPSMVSGKQRTLPEGVSCEPGLAETLNKDLNVLPVRQIILGIFTGVFWKEFVTMFPISLHPRAIKRSSVWIYEAMLISEWVKNYILKEQINLEECLFYTYWFETSASGISLTKESFPNIKFISRAHGYDVYEERYEPAYIPLRKTSLHGLDLLFLISEDGFHYLSNKYPQYARKFEYARMGVFPAEFSNHSSQDGICRVVSCSNIIPVKRVDLICKGLQYLARMQPNQRFSWQHFGDGPLMTSIASLANGAPHNLSVCLRGETPHEDILAYYAKNSIDVFINTSKSEGIPVAIMEAQSFGIPVIATKVGGNQEIVNSQNGHLMSQDPSEDEIAKAIWDLFKSPNYRSKRAASFETWQQKYNANKNYSEFAKEIRSLLNGSLDNGMDE